MAAADYYTQVYTMFVGYYGRPPAQSGLDYYAGLVDKAGGSMAVVIDDFFKSAESQAFFAGKSVEQQVNQIFQNLFGRDALPAGLNYWAGLITNGTVALSQAAYTIANNAAAADVAIRDAKVASAKAWVAGLDTTAEILVYGTEAGRTAGRDFLKAVATSTPATQEATEAALKAMVDGGATNPGKVFPLTIGEDRLTGGAGDDTFNALAVEQQGATGSKATLENFDILNGGAGSDTLNATLTDAGAAPVLQSIETVNVRFAGAQTLNLTSATGVEAINVQTSTVAGTVDGVGAVANLAVKNQLVGATFDTSTAATLNLGLDTVGVATAANVAVDLGATKQASATTLNITANNANATVQDTAGGLAATVTIAATGANRLNLADAAVAKNVTITGAGSVDLIGSAATTLGTAFTGALATFNASAAEGAIKADIRSTVLATVTTGKGADWIDMDTAVVAGTTVNLGAGNDTLLTGALLGNFAKVDGGDGDADTINIVDGAKLDAANAKLISNFEVLDVSDGKGSYDVSLNNFATVQIDESVTGAAAAALNAAVIFANAGDAFTLNIASEAKTNANFVVGNTITVNGKDYAGTTATGNAETFTLVANMRDGNKDDTADGNINANTITVAAVEHIVVDAGVSTLDGGAKALGAAQHTLTAKIVAAAAETLTVKGAASVDLSGATTIGVVTKVDATGSTGNVTIDLSTHAKSVAYFGSEGIDVYKASTRGDNIYTGKGADQVTLTAGVRDTFVLKAATDSQIGDTDKSGKITIAGDEVNAAAPAGFQQTIDTITGFVAGGLATTDRLDVTNFAFSGAQRGVVDVTAIVTNTTDLTSIADLFAAPAGDRGLAVSLIGTNTYVFVDVNKDGNFTAADDSIIKLVAVAAPGETDINF